MRNLLSALALMVFAAACGGDGGGNPVDPGTPIPHDTLPTQGNGLARLAKILELGTGSRSFIAGARTDCGRTALLFDGMVVDVNTATESRVTHPVDGARFVATDCQIVAYNSGVKNVQFVAISDWRPLGIGGTANWIEQSHTGYFTQRGTFENVGTNGYRQQWSVSLHQDTAPQSHASPQPNLTGITGSAMTRNGAVLGQGTKLQMLDRNGALVHTINSTFVNTRGWTYRSLSAFPTRNGFLAAGDSMIQELFLDCPEGHNSWPHCSNRNYWMAGEVMDAVVTSDNSFTAITRRGHLVFWRAATGDTNGLAITALDITDCSNAFLMAWNGGRTAVLCGSQLRVYELTSGASSNISAGTFSEAPPLETREYRYTYRDGVPNAELVRTSEVRIQRRAVQ